jgi:hypothetical protein
MVSDRGPDSIGTDQRQCDILLARHAAPLDHRQSSGMRHRVFELAPEPQLDVGMVVDLGKQRCLQIGAVYHPIGRTGARRGGFAERQARKFAAASRTHDADGLGRDRVGGESRLQSEVDQYAAGVGGELQAGAGFLESLGLLKHDDAKTLSRERERGRQSSDPGTSDEDGA